MGYLWQGGRSDRYSELEGQSCCSSFAALFRPITYEQYCLHELPRYRNVSCWILSQPTSSIGSCLVSPMAPVLRPSMLRQARLPVPACRASAVQPWTMTRFSGFHTSAINRKPPSLRISSLRPSRARSYSPTPIQAAAFHASGQRSILPGEPRECSPRVLPRRGT